MKTILVTGNLCHKKTLLIMLRGSIISILFGSDAILSGSNGGTMPIHISSSNPFFSFVTTVSQPARIPGKTGKILNVGSPPLDPPGAYSGIS